MREYTLKTQLAEEGNIILSNIISYENDIVMGNKYNTTLTLEVISNNGYRGKSNFILDINQLENFIKQLFNIATNLIGYAKLIDNGYGSYLNISINKLGDILISGILFDEHREQELKFSFDVDQTFINNISKNLYQDIVVERQQLI